MNIRIVWILIALAFVIAELATLSLTMIWFTIGAISALIVSYFVDSIIIQILVFGVVSFVLLYIVTKKLIKLDRDKNNKYWASIDTNTDAIIGKKGFVIKEITPKEVGLVKVKGEDWTAISCDSELKIEKGAEIVVESV